jgi:hypothetical protein
MTSTHKHRVRKRLCAVALAIGALTFAAPVAGASAAITPFSFFGSLAPFAGFVPSGTSLVGAPQTGVGISGCGENRPSVIGGSGTASAVSCFSVLSFIGPAIGQINSQVGPTIIGSTILAPITLSAGPVVNTVP